MPDLPHLLVFWAPLLTVPPPHHRLLPHLKLAFSQRAGLAAGMEWEGDGLGWVFEKKKKVGINQGMEWEWDGLAAAAGPGPGCWSRSWTGNWIGNGAASL
jgi:hypothetical protein